MRRQLTATATAARRRRDGVPLQAEQAAASSDTVQSHIPPRLSELDQAALFFKQRGQPESSARRVEAVIRAPARRASVIVV